MCRNGVVVYSAEAGAESETKISNSVHLWQEVFLQFPCKRKRGWWLKIVWYWRSHFGPTKVREHFPEEELTLGKNMLLQVASLVEW